MSDRAENDVVADRDGRGRRSTVLAALYAVGTVTALVIWATVGDVWWAQPINVTTFWWTLPAVFLVGAAVATRRWKAVVLLAVPAGVFLWSYGGQFLPAADAQVRGDLRVVTFNTYVHAPDLDHVLSVVREEQPDVLLLQEVFPERQERLQTALMEELPNSWFGESARVGGVALFTRLPILDVRDIAPASDPTRPTAVVTVEVDQQAVQIVPVHFISPCRECGPIAPRLEFEGDVRVAEVRAVLDALDPGLPAIVGGDFNSNDRSEPYGLFLDAGFEDPQYAVGSGPGFTWPADRAAGPFLRIDWILVRGLRPVDAYVGDAGASDHRPVVVDLALEG